MPPKTQPILIIGAGVFGLTTALELSKRGYKDITLLDRTLPPVPDGSSVDVSRIIRPDYADAFYAQMGLDALNGWKGEFAPFFHHSGLLCVQSQGSAEYLEQAKANLQALGSGVNIQTFRGGEANAKYPGIHGDLAATSGYWNLSGGWADAEGSIAYLARRCAQAGVSLISGRHGTVTSLVTSPESTSKKREGKRKIHAVRTAAGTTLSADTIILATGAWTPYLLDMSGRSVSTGQPVAFIQLTPEEAADMQDGRTPVMIDLSTGWFAFPPTPGTNLLKMARHGYGYEAVRSVPSSSSSSSSPPSSSSSSSPSSSPETRNDKFSAPALPPSSSSSKTTLPKDAEQALRAGLALFLPRFKDRPFAQQRLCWYTDTPRGDFIVDYHPEYEGLFLATGGSGHAFKFLPILGPRIADSFEGVASPAQKQKWAWSASKADISRGDGSRGGPPRRVLRGEEEERAML
ncbi:NAD(P)/FAD-dependent oxidoreductase [Aspergillus candidus]|uniref:FAD dependent oxidoreductase n=1 Tax=Aspergillus candidus TaxID=41067 RepID=A0A2I2FJR9_ASPCN|nr:FAD dependent oxidoreductase [Aspergillus candidus]PLB40887.1 FAD dependent oxidoreductase [Aspergillus candidus]